MINDLWYLGDGYWAAYSEDMDLVSEFKGLKEMQMTATYGHYRRHGIRAAQFRFHQGEELSSEGCLLSYVCSRMDLEFSRAVALARKNDSTPYSRKYPVSVSQLKLFPADCQKPPAQKGGKKKSVT